MPRALSRLAPALVALGSALAACDAGTIDNGGAGGGDVGVVGGGGDMTFKIAYDLAGADLSGGAPNACGDTDPGCMSVAIGPPAGMFPLQSDPKHSGQEADTGIDRDDKGWLGLSSSKSNFDFVWAALTADWNIGTVSKMSSKSLKEVARYFTVTCFSNPGGSRAACDGKNGCCSRDDYVDFQYRLAHNGQSSGVHQKVQTVDNNPSRTAVDFNGDMFVSNRAFAGQSSVTRIANDPSECVDRNGTPGIQTSSDVNGDGVIDTDCNQNGVPDDIADVKAKPCTNGKPQEFYGLDDECVLFTTNTNVPMQFGRPLALGPGSQAFGPADAWAGTFQDGKWFRIDGATGMTKAQAKTGPSVYGAAIDSAGVLWTPVVGTSTLYYFDTGNPGTTGTARASAIPNVPNDAYGITLDRDQNVWTGGYPSGNACRYTPNRTGDFTKLGQGFWTIVQNPGNLPKMEAGDGTYARGIAADSRTKSSYFVWMGRHPYYIVRVPASTIAVPVGADKLVDGSTMAAIKVAGTAPAGAGVDTDQNVWAISSGNSVATRIKVDAQGNFVAPNITAGTDYTGCPLGDRCTFRFQHPDGPKTLTPDPTPYTYSDFTGFGLRNFTNPKGSYSWVQPGCGNQETHWLKVVWDGDVPKNTQLTLRARVGNTPIPDDKWGKWTGDYATSPADLTMMPGPLLPDPAPYMQLEFDFVSQDKASTPKLKGFHIVYKCGMKIG